MELFWKAAAGTLLAVILGLEVKRQEKDMDVLLTVALCAMLAGIALKFLQPVLVFLKKLVQLGDLREDMLETLLKAAGIGLTAEISAMVCTDAGNDAAGKMIRFVGSMVILSLSLPLLSSLMDLILEMVGQV